MAQALPFSAQLYLLEDHARTLFPLTTTKVVAIKALAEIQQRERLPDWQRSSWRGQTVKPDRRGARPSRTLK
jgi:hypothetical protein